MKASPSSAPPQVGKNYAAWWLAAGLVLAIGAAYWPVAGYAFTDLDDNDYVWANPHVLSGLTWSGVGWAFTHFSASNWHPLTWLSHMLDVQLFGPNAGAHHVTNVLFHAANTVLLLFWLRRLTGYLWRSALVAALFALHPLHVESVAWVSERKDVLSTFFLLLSLMAYTRYAETQRQKAESRMQKLASSEPSAIRQLPSPISYLLALLCFALGLMSKPMVVTLPFVLLLLDYWPLGRISTFNFQVGRRLVWEKIPFFALSAGSCAVTFLAQKSNQAVMDTTMFPVTDRIGNTLISYSLYLQKMVWPEGLAAFYPLFYPVNMERVVVPVFVLALVSAGVFIYGRQRPYLLTGWWWYLGTLVPVIGLVQVGSAALADRYTYVPLIGIFIAIVWLVAELSAAWPFRQPILTVLALGVLGGCWQLTAAQVRVWQNSETLARHALAVTTQNAPMELILGNTLLNQKKLAEAVEHLNEALRIQPDSQIARHDLAVALVEEGRLEEAIELCRANLKLSPKEFKIHYLLANALQTQGHFEEAIAEYQAVLQLKPDYLLALNDLAWLLATAPEARLRNGTEAVRLAEKACQLSKYQVTLSVGTLGAAYAEAGRFEDAEKTAQKAVALAMADKNAVLVKKNRELLESYQHKIAYHESARH